MIRLATVIGTFEAEFLAQYRDRVRPEHYRALGAMKHCRTQASLKMQAQCTECAHQKLVPHSCGHRHCPHCQHHESQQWLERQLKKQLKFAPGRALAWFKQRAPILCTCCGAVMVIVKTRIRSVFSGVMPAPIATPGAH
jgi:hypothetical protein